MWWTALSALDIIVISNSLETLNHKGVLGKFFFKTIFTLKSWDTGHTSVNYLNTLAEVDLIDAKNPFLRIYYKLLDF